MTDRKSMCLAYPEDKPNKESTGENNSGDCRMNIRLNTSHWKASELMASPATQRENSSCVIACIKNDAKDRSVKDL